MRNTPLTVSIGDTDLQLSLTLSGFRIAETAHGVRFDFADMEGDGLRTATMLLDLAWIASLPFKEWSRDEFLMFVARSGDESVLVQEMVGIAESFAKSVEGIGNSGATEKKEAAPSA